MSMTALREQKCKELLFSLFFLQAGGCEERDVFWQGEAALPLAAVGAV